MVYFVFKISKFSLIELNGFRFELIDKLGTNVDILTESSAGERFYNYIKKTRCCFMEDKDVLILEEIINYCDKIANSIAKYGNSYELFDQNPDYQDVCAFQTMQIGE